MIASVCPSSSCCGLHSVMVTFCEKSVKAEYVKARAKCWRAYQWCHPALADPVLSAQLCLRLLEQTWIQSGAEQKRTNRGSCKQKYEESGYEQWTNCSKNAFGGYILSVYKYYANIIWFFNIYILSNLLFILLSEWLEGAQLHLEGTCTWFEYLLFALAPLVACSVLFFFFWYLPWEFPNHKKLLH